MHRKAKKKQRNKSGTARYWNGAARVHRKIKQVLKSNGVAFAKAYAAKVMSSAYLAKLLEARGV